MQSEIDKIRNWKAPEEREDPALEFPPPDEPDQAAKQQAKPKPKPKAKNPSAPKAKAKSDKKTGWFIEAYPIVEKDGKVVIDMANMVPYGPIATTTPSGAMKAFNALAEKSPGALSHHSIRIVNVVDVFSTRSSQVVKVVR